MMHKPPVGLVERILANTFTRAECARRLGILRDLASAKTYGGAHEPEIDDMDHAAVAEWGTEPLAYLEEGHMGERLAAIRQALETLPTLTLTVPRMFLPENLGRIAAWCRREIAPGLLLDLKIDAAALGGCAIAWQGFLHDFSYAYFLRKHAAAVDQMIDRVLAGP